MGITESVAYLQESVELPSFSASLKRFLWKANFIAYSAVKRVLDFVFAGLLLILLFPVMMVIAALIKKEDGDPIIFKQLRTGRNGKDFYIYKFRTMPVSNDVLDKTCADRHTKIGTLLRKTSLDELPQLFNIVKGEMSFIGPRPWITEYYKAMNYRERTRTVVRPGITGLAQANGRNGISIHEKIDLDLEYVKTYSIFTDIRVIFESVKAVLSKEDADAGKGVIHDELEELRAENKLFIGL